MEAPLSTESASHLLLLRLLSLPGSLELGQWWDFLHDAVRTSRIAALMYDGEKVKQPRGNLCPLSLL